MMGSKQDNDERRGMEKLNMQTEDLTQDNIERIGELFPNALTETIEDGETKRAIDFDVLREELSADIVDGSDERYQFTWPGKRKAIKLANAPINKTLRPVREESVDFDTTENLYIEGDNLEALKLLRETYLGKIKMIYIDPPYNTGNDFVYKDDFRQSADEHLEESGQVDEEGGRLVANPSTAGRYHSDWLNMMYPRLKLARDLLSENGVIYISIDDNEIANLSKICEEVFDERNFLGLFVRNSTPSARDYGHIGKMHDYVLFIGKDSDRTLTRMLPENDKSFNYADERGGFNVHPLYNANESFSKENRPNLFYPFYLYPDNPIGENFFEIGLEKRENAVEIFPPKSLKNGVQFVWRWGKTKAKENLVDEIIGYQTNEGNYRVVQKMRHNEKIIRSLLVDKKYSSRRGTAELEELFGRKTFDFPKPLSLLVDFVASGSSSGDIILDMFAGSCTTAHAVMLQNSRDGEGRRFIMIQLDESCSSESQGFKAGFKDIASIGKERIRRAGAKTKEEAGLMGENLDIGFRVLKVDTSNMRDIYYRPDETDQTTLLDLADNIKEDRTPEDLLFQVMLEMGIPLSASITESQVEGKTVFAVSDSNESVFLLACFDTDISDEVVTEMANRKPLYAVLRDSGMADDSVAANFEQIFKTQSPQTEIKVL